MWRHALLLLAVTARPIDGVNNPDAELVRLLDRTVWIDIGPGRNLASLTAKQIAGLQRCKEPTMAFEKSGKAWVQSFYAGIEMRTVYASAVLKNDAPAKTVLFYTTDKAAPAETLHIDRNVLVEQARGFRPHTFLKCNPPKPKPRNQ